MNLLWHYSLIINFTEYTFVDYEPQPYKVYMKLIDRKFIIREKDDINKLELWYFISFNNFGQENRKEIYSGKIIEDLFFLDSLLRHLLSPLLEW